MSRRGAVGAAAVVVATLLAAAGCSYTRESDDAPTTTAGPATDPSAPSSTTTTTAPEDLPDLEDVDIELDEVATVGAPTALAVRAGDPALYVTEQVGRVRRIAIETRRRGSGSNQTVTQSFQLERNPVLDISDQVTFEGEQGLLGITFSTDGSHLYLAYTGTDSKQHLVEYAMGTDSVEDRSAREILVIDDFAPNHNGGMLAIGPDGYLYWSMGDGGGAGDPRNTGQDPSDLLGSILRIDPDVDPDEGGPAYAIPNGNPFADGADGAPEVWAYGLRNPWRFSFDRRTGDLWIGDVGQSSREEVDFLPATGGTNAGRGANLGWSELEGTASFQGGEAPEDAIPPLFDYGRGSSACSVTGGYVYRGTRIASLIGVYLFTDYCDGRLRGAVQHDGELDDAAPLGPEVAAPVSFGEDADGELYVLSQEGTVFRIVAPRDDAGE